MLARACPSSKPPEEGPLAKSDREKMEILEAFDVTAATSLLLRWRVACDPKTVQR